MGVLLLLLALAGITVAHIDHLPGQQGQHHHHSSLTWKHFPAGANGFFRAPMLISGAHDAVLIDGGFTLSDGVALAESIKRTGKNLKTVYISQGDPDYYFSLAPIKAAFPSARFIAASAAIASINATVQKKIDVWGPHLKDNGPQKVSDVVKLEQYESPSFSLEGHEIEIINATGLPNTRYLYSKSLNAIFGGVLIFSGVHVWTADTPSAESRNAWIKELDAIAARHPNVVIPGHMVAGDATDVSAVKYTREYLVAFSEEAAKAKDSVALIAAMTKRYPKADLLVALETGAKVIKGELKWP